MSEIFEQEKLFSVIDINNQYSRQLHRLSKVNINTSSIEDTVEGVIKNITSNNATSLVVYGDPQSGKTEMMIGLTAALLDKGYRTIIHLMNDSVDLLTQNLNRFMSSGLSPAPKNYSELTDNHINRAKSLVIFCKKNSSDLTKLTEKINALNPENLILIDDEADYATPNGKINRGLVTKINELIGGLLENRKSFYIGVTATPARLDLNNTFSNDPDQWVQFKPHAHYTGQDIFFPLSKNNKKYRLRYIKSDDIREETETAICRFLVTAAYINNEKLVENKREENWTMLIHTSGRTADHKMDKDIAENFIGKLTSITDSAGSPNPILKKLFDIANELYASSENEVEYSILKYIVENSSRITCLLLNSERDKKTINGNAAEPKSPFTIIIGGNIVSRGVTFPNLLAMYFTRDVKNKLQQDTYIQRARMFGARGNYLEHFELTIPESLYKNWKKCFIFHQLALKTINNKMGAPVWLGDSKISVASNSSIDKATVQLDKGEMAFGLFDYNEEIASFTENSYSSIEKLKELQKIVGEKALPSFLIDFIETSIEADLGILAIHKPSSISNYSEAEGIDKDMIVRKKGFLGSNQLKSIPGSLHIKILYNENNKARVFFKFTDGVSVIQNNKQIMLL